MSLPPLLSLLSSSHCLLRDIYSSYCLFWACSPSLQPTLWVPAHQPATLSLQPYQQVSASFSYPYLLGSCRTATSSKSCQDTPHLDLLEGLCTLLQAMDPEEFQTLFSIQSSLPKHSSLLPWMSLTIGSAQHAKAWIPWRSSCSSSLPCVWKRTLFLPFCWLSWTQPLVQNSFYITYELQIPSKLWNYATWRLLWWHSHQTAHNVIYFHSSSW